MLFPVGSPENHSRRPSRSHSQVFVIGLTDGQPTHIGPITEELVSVVWFSHKHEQNDTLTQKHCVSYTASDTISSEAWLCRHSRFHPRFGSCLPSCWHFLMNILEPESAHVQHRRVLDCGQHRCVPVYNPVPGDEQSTQRRILYIYCIYAYVYFQVKTVCSAGSVPEVSVAMAISKSPFIN